MASSRQQAVACAAGLSLAGDSPAFSGARLAPPGEAAEVIPWLDRLVRTIEGEVIPRLMLAHRADEVLSAAPSAGLDVDQFVRTLRASDTATLIQRVEALQAQGVTLESVFLDLLAPAARRLGELWEEDECDFTEVTVALCRLQHVARRIGQQRAEEFKPGEPNPRVLLTVTFGDQHIFGLAVVSEFFRRAGWEVVEDSSGSMGDLTQLVRHEWFDLVGLSVSTEDRLGPAAALVQALRRASLNRKLGVFAGGAALAGRAERIAQIGADAGATDAQQAVRQANEWVAGMRVTDQAPFAAN